MRQPQNTNGVQIKACLFAAIAGLQLLCSELAAAQPDAGAEGGAPLTESAQEPEASHNESFFISHSVGKEGRPFPPPEDVVMQPVPTSTPEMTPTPAPEWTPQPYAAPRRCLKDGTQRELFSPDDRQHPAENKVPYSDMLFVAEDLVPIDPEEAFGPNVRIIPYEAVLEPNQYPLLMMEIYDVPCLPYRIRVTNLARYTDTGLNALKLYSGGPAHKGKLSPLIQRKLFGSSKPQGRR